MHKPLITKTNAHLRIKWCKNHQDWSAAMRRQRYILQTHGLLTWVWVHGNSIQNCGSGSGLFQEDDPPANRVIDGCENDVNHTRHYQNTKWGKYLFSSGGVTGTRGINTKLHLSCSGCTCRPNTLLKLCVMDGWRDGGISCLQFTVNKRCQ